MMAKVFKIEHGKVAYWADFVLYGAAILALTLFLFLSGDRIGPLQMLGYALTHHAIHNWTLNLAWLRRLKRIHALHHMGTTPTYFGVTSSFWDRVFGSNR
jgi:sterol desaturase/sphingolipid hydroxylase (fatty acid hydroxylase superfamily)